MNPFIDVSIRCFRMRGAALLYCCLCWCVDAQAIVQDEIDGDNFEGFTQVACDGGLPSASSDPTDYAKAIDVCQVGSSFAPGLISASLTLADGTSAPAIMSRSIRNTFGTQNVPRFGSSFIVLSTGAAAALGQTAPSYSDFQPGLNTGTSSAMPSDWLAANGGIVPVAPGCPDLSGSNANNPVMLTLHIRVPNNARSFTVNANYLTSDYPEDVCSPYSDVFLVLLDSSYAGSAPNPADKNLARYYVDPTHIYRVGVELARDNTGLFTQCINGPTGCAGPVMGTMSVCSSTSDLTNTGMDISDNVCGGNNLVGGGTGWLAVRGNVVPGEAITLRFAIWDTSDGFFDSLVLLDNFKWSASSGVPGASLP